ncbi:RAMP superfamily CRISPR-associated protein [Thermoflexus hugenholtzii]
MTFDYWIDLTSLPGEGEFPASPEEAAWNLASGFVDRCAEQAMGGDARRIQARDRYVREVASKTFSLPSDLKGPNFGSAYTGWPASWFALEVEFELLTPWYSKDDRVFHVMDNPVRKDRVFGVPFMAASSWKGLLRWACRIQVGLREHLRKNEGRIEGWRDPDWILHLFGNEKGEEETFHQGALVFYPTWFDQIGFEVINPHSRARRAGIQPIYYEVVPPGAKGTLYLLYAPWPGMKPTADPGQFLPWLLEAIDNLLTHYGISAKRTVGWGTAKITKWKAYRQGQAPAQADTRDQLRQAIRNRFS